MLLDDQKRPQTFAQQIPAPSNRSPLAFADLKVAGGGDLLEGANIFMNLTWTYLSKPLLIGLQHRFNICFLFVRFASLQETMSCPLLSLNDIDQIESNILKFIIGHSS